RLASAVDSGLLAAIRESLQGKAAARLISVQPRLMSKFNEWRKSIPDAGAWLVLAEPDRACVALHAEGRWRSVQNGKGAWRALLDRERHRVRSEERRVGKECRCRCAVWHKKEEKAEWRSVATIEMLSQDESGRSRI